MNPKAEQYKAYLLQEFNKRQGMNQGVVSPVQDMQNPLPSEQDPGPLGKAYMNVTNKIQGFKTNLKNTFSLGTRIQAKAPVAERPTVTPMPTRTPTPTPLPTPMPGMPAYFDYDKYRVKGDYQPKQPPQEIANTIWRENPKDATRSALIAATESGFNKDAYNFNSQASGRFKDSGDYGLMQINSVTLQDYLRSHPKQLQSMGIRTVEDLKDPKKAIKLSQLIAKVQGHGAWYGPKNRGFDITKE